MHPSSNPFRFMFLALCVTFVATMGVCIRLFNQTPNSRTPKGSTAGEAIPISLNGGNAVNFTGKSAIQFPVKIKPATTGDGYTYVVLDLDVTGRDNYAPPAGCSKYDGVNPWPCQLSQNTTTVTLTLTSGGNPSSFAIYSWEVKDYQNHTDPDKSIQANSVPAAPIPGGF